VGAIEGESAPGLYPVLPLSDTVMEMADISLDGVEQEIVVGPSTTVEFVPTAPAQVKRDNDKVDYMVRYWESMQPSLKNYYDTGIVKPVNI